MVGDVLSGAVDVGFAEAAEAAQNTGLQVEPVRKSQMFFFCAAGHPLAGKERLGFEDLLEYPWAGPTLPERIRAVLPIADKPFAVFDRRARVAFILARSSDRSPRPSRSFSPDTRSSAAIPSQIARELSEGLCVRLPIATPWLSLNYGFITKRGRTLSPAAKAFMDIAREIESAVPQ